MTPAGALGDVDARAWAAVATGARTVRAVAAAVGCPVTTAYSALCRLRDEGLVLWEPGLAATLRTSHSPTGGPP